MADREPSFTIRDLPREERPRERLQKLGSEALSSVELLALVIGRGVPGKSALTIAHDLLKRFKSVQGVSAASLEELAAVPGIGVAKAAQLKASFELGKRQDLDPEKPVRFEITSPGLVVKAINTLIADKAKEHFKLLVLNTRNEVIVIAPVSVGTANASLVHPREVFRAAISHGASSVVLAHNHPSGNPEPSDDDIALTRRLAEAGRLLGIEVLDHIVIGKEDKEKGLKGFISFKEKGLL